MKKSIRIATSVMLSIALLCLVSISQVFAHADEVVVPVSGSEQPSLTSDYSHFIFASFNQGCVDNYATAQAKIPLVDEHGAPVTVLSQLLETRAELVE